MSVKTFAACGVWVSGGQASAADNRAEFALTDVEDTPDLGVGALGAGGGDGNNDEPVEQPDAEEEQAGKHTTVHLAIAAGQHCDITAQDGSVAITDPSGFASPELRASGSHVAPAHRNHHKAKVQASPIKRKLAKLHHLGQALKHRSASTCATNPQTEQHPELGTPGAQCSKKRARASAEAASPLAAPATDPAGFCSERFFKYTSAAAEFVEECGSKVAIGHSVEKTWRESVRMVRSEQEWVLEHRAIFEASLPADVPIPPITREYAQAVVDAGVG